MVDEGPLTTYGSSGSPPGPVHTTVRDGDLAKLQALLRAGVNVDGDDPRAQTALMAAVVSDNPEAARMLLEAGADPFRPYHDALSSYTPLGVSASRGRAEIARLMWSTLPLDRLAQHENDPVVDSCLVAAATYGHTGLLEYLLDGWLDSLGWSARVLDRALLGAVNAWHVHAAAVLIDRVKTYSPDILQRALFAAVDFKGITPAERYPVYQGVDFTNQERLVKRLIEAGPFNPDTCTKHGRPLIHHAVDAVNVVGALRAVLAKGADPNARDDKGRTPLQRISVPIPTDIEQQESTAIHETGIHLLLEHGASVTAADHQGETPLHAAAYGCDLHLFRRLLLHSNSQGVTSLYTANSHGETLTHYAAAGGNIGVLRFLLEESATDFDVSKANSNGWTPLLCALAPTFIEGNSPQLARKTPGDAVQAAQLLLSHGASAEGVTTEGWSALHCLSCYRSHPGDTRFSALAETLLQKGASLDAKARSLSPGWYIKPDWYGVEGYYPPEDGFPWGFRMKQLSEVAPEGVFDVEATTAIEWARRSGAKAVEGVLLAHGGKPAPLRLYSSFFSSSGKA